jgi:phage terminase large subunit
MVKPTATRKIQLPNNWRPRNYQIPLWNHLIDGGKRAMAIWHRRAGKDDVALHYTACAMAERPGNYWHCLPEYEQGRKAIFNAVNPHTGLRRIDEAFPRELRANTNDNEMFIRFKNGSTWQVVGSDRYDATVGAGVAGIVYSEYALSNPSAWAYHRPMLQENDGWATFISTPRGRNHAFEMASYAARTPGWFYELLTVEDTQALSQEALALALEEYKALYGIDQGEAQFQQEYYCSWQSALLGSYYAAEMSLVRQEGRIVDDLDPIPGKAVHHAWDLGVGHDTSIWFFQACGSQLLILDHLSSSGKGVEWYRDRIFEIHSSRGWVRGTDYVPHDAKVREWGTGRTRVETMRSLDLFPDLVPAHSIDDGINAVRQTLPLCVFHSRTEPSGVSALEQYRREWDDEKKCFKSSALDDWTADTADAFRYLAVSWRPAGRKKPKPRPPQFTGWLIPAVPEPTRRPGIVL